MKFLFRGRIVAFTITKPYEIIRNSRVSQDNKNNGRFYQISQIKVIISYILYIIPHFLQVQNVKKKYEMARTGYEKENTKWYKMCI